MAVLHKAINKGFQNSEVLLPSCFSLLAFLFSLLIFYLSSILPFYYYINYFIKPLLINGL